MSNTMTETARGLHDPEKAVPITPRDSASLNNVPGNGNDGAAVPGSNGSEENLVPGEGEEEEAVPMTRWQRFQAHLKRNWYWYLLGNICFLAIILPVFLLVVIPAIIQLVVNKGGLPLYHGNITAISNDRVELSLDTQFPGLSGITVTLDAFNASLYNPTSGGKDYPYVDFPVPQETYEGNHNISIPAVQTGVKNRTELAFWLKHLLIEDKWNLSLYGSSAAHLGALKGHVNIDKTIQIPTLQNLGTSEISTAELVAPAPQDGGNLKGRVIVNNFSNLTIGLGNLTFNTLAGDLNIGQISINNFVSSPGPMSFFYTGSLNLGNILKNLASVLKSQKEYLPRGVLGITLTGNSTLINGEHITYLESFLNPARLKSELPISALLGGLVTGLKSGDLQIPALLEQVAQELPSADDKLVNILKKYGLVSNSNSTS